MLNLQDKITSILFCKIMKLKKNTDEELAAFAYKQVAACHRHHPAQRVYLRILLKKNYLYPKPPPLHAISDSTSFCDGTARAQHGAFCRASFIVYKRRVRRNINTPVL